MQVVILAGGLGTRLAEKTKNIPKPMVEVGGIPIIEHIMRIYSKQGHCNFLIACGYKQEAIKRYFYEKLQLGNDLTIDFSDRKITNSSPSTYKNWRVSMIDTGQLTQTGSRLKKLENYLDDRFFLTYGDGVGNVDLDRLLTVHSVNDAQLTVTSVHPVSRYGSLLLDGDRVAEFDEKPEFNTKRVNAGFMVVQKEFLNQIPPNSEDIVLENEPFNKAVNDRKMCAYHHTGFWHPMDTLRDNIKLNELYSDGQAPWFKL